jgi:hypothetical protein
MRCLMVVALGACVCFAAVAQSEEQPKEKLGAPSRVIATCVAKGQVYALNRERDGHMFCYLQRASLTPPGRQARVQKLPIPHSEWESAFHIHKDTYYGTNAFIHFATVLNGTRLSNLKEKHKREYWEHWTTMRISPLWLLGVKNSKFRDGDFDYSGTREATYAFTIDPDGKLFVFLAWKKRLSIWSGKAPRVDEEEPPSYSVIRWDNWKEKKATVPDPKPFRVVETDIENQYFLAYQDKSDWYFVTDTGRVLRLPRNDKAKRTECIWEDLRRPVRLVLEDNATGKTWAFAPRKDNRGKKVPDVYFPLAQKIEPVQYDSTKLPAWDLGKPLAMALAHARFLLKEKKVSLDEKKPKPADKK